MVTHVGLNLKDIGDLRFLLKEVDVLDTKDDYHEICEHIYKLKNLLLKYYGA